MSHRTSIYPILNQQKKKKVFPGICVRNRTVYRCLYGEVISRAEVRAEQFSSNFECVCVCAVKELEVFGYIKFIFNYYSLLSWVPV